MKFGAARRTKPPAEMDPAAAAHGDAPSVSLKPRKFICFRPDVSHSTHPTETSDVKDHTHRIGEGVLVGALNGNPVVRGRDVRATLAAPDTARVLIGQRRGMAGRRRRAAAR